MANQLLNSIKNRLKSLLNPGTKPGSEEAQVKFARKEQIIVFLVAYIMAVSLWFIVNLNGSFNISLNIPIETGTVSQNLALTEPLPEFAQVSMNGDGWQLLNLYNDPPVVAINVQEGEINLFDQIRQQLNYLPDVDITKVQPLVLSINMEERIQKKIPVKINTDLRFQQRYGLVGNPTLSPDSIIISGAVSLIQDINQLELPDTLSLTGIKDDIQTSVPVDIGNPLINVSDDQVTYTANVSEFTEGETTVYIETRDLPRGQNINYTPSAVTIRYDVPLEQYARVQSIQPYQVYVPYSKILEDSTGFVTPDIELTATQYQLKLRNFQPKAIAYFSVLEQ
ncbi:MAG: hypothetical protein FH748_01235 [Balneolaceae bacterium]|nr:hypothetical protein [Balneolaceae bacterium]